MSQRNDVAPSTVSISLVDYGVEVEYLDGRTAVYRGVPQKREGSVTTAPGKETHVLVTDPTETEGVMLYVNDYKTDDDILEGSGVGRILLDGDEEEEVFPGVTVHRLGSERTEVTADPEVARGRVFVFAEDDWSEQSYEIVSSDEAGADEPSGEDAGESSDADTTESSDATDADEGV
ncbi:DUF5796 family protein [Halobium salinum]|uniref:DUF5796 family protein n=1 Tax=Halobium salinum TaxID=1364940 RepID=A0ABD5PH96_9EURY